ncbi:hypothetical protein KUTeg_003471 [Tegillarca granosa]|uniref:Uncharacterized protein n=1 Tax=Tegillarca granosa TaxID=220873 RepID=A0ABQ9FM95_TEGGR|nr:hypothetical protein KUTeg_003471 [Tegillarca granosa]
MELRQQRTTTELGSLQFEENVNKYISKLTNIEKQIDQYNRSSTDEGVELAQVKQLHDTVIKLCDQYEAVYSDFKVYLTGFRSTESKTILGSVSHAREIVIDQVKSFQDRLNSALSKVEPHGSQRSKHSIHGSKRSSRISGASSHLTSVYLKQTAKLEEAKTRYKYAAEEAELIKKEAELKATRTLLKVKRELEEAETGLGAICKALEFSNSNLSESYVKPTKPATQSGGDFLRERYLKENMNNNEPPCEVEHEVKTCIPSVTQNTVNVLCPQATPFYPVHSQVSDILERLDSEYGSPETIENSLKTRIANFPFLNESDQKRYFDISDLAAEVESVKCDSNFGLAFAYYDTVSGINDFVRKLPKRLRGKWAVESDRYKTTNNVSHVPFSLLTKFLRDIARIKNDPCYVFETSPDDSKNRPKDSDSDIRPEVSVCKLEQLDFPVQFRTFSDMFSRFSVWNRLVHFVAHLKFCASRFRTDKSNLPSSPYDPDFLQRCEHFLFPCSRFLGCQKYLVILASQRKIFDCLHYVYFSPSPEDRNIHVIETKLQYEATAETALNKKKRNISDTNKP